MEFLQTYFPLIGLILMVIIIVLLVMVLLSQLSKQALANQFRKFGKEAKAEGQDMLDSLQDAVMKELDGESWKNENRSGDLKGAIGDLKTELLRNHNEEQQKLFENLDKQSTKMTELVSGSLDKMQQSNAQKLEEMRQTVDEKLSKTLNERLEGSFKTVSDQLKNVYESLTEMKKLGDGVSDLQRVLTNVKARGTWAEVQLGNLLEQTLTSAQFERNVSPRNNSERVEFAVKIPARDDESSFVWLPIDSKFPQEDYLRIVEASDNADKVAMEAATKALENTIRSFAKTIMSLYIEVPKTTDFAIMFLPTEGLYAEVLRRSALVEEIQQKYHVMICGPTTITAFLNTLRVGFRTIALDKQASEVWKLLEATKAQYETFNDQLGKAKKKIEEAGKAIDVAQNRSGIIHKKLKGVESLEGDRADLMLGLTADSLIDEAVEEDEA